MKSIVEVNFFEFDQKLLDAFCSYGCDNGFSPSTAAKVLISRALTVLGYLNDDRNIDVKP